jgi:hypothetical protein
VTGVAAQPMTKRERDDLADLDTGEPVTEATG